MKGWYWAAVDRVPSPSRVTLDRITEERVGLYSYVPPLGENIPVSNESLPVDDLLPMEDDIEWAVKQLRNHRYRGPSGMRANHIKGWLAEARKKERYEATEEQKSATEGTKEVPNRTGGGGEEREGRIRLRKCPTGRGW